MKKRTELNSLPVNNSFIVAISRALVLQPKNTFFIADGEKMNPPSLLKSSVPVYIARTSSSPSHALYFVVRIASLNTAITLSIGVKLSPQSSSHAQREFCSSANGKLLLYSISESFILSLSLKRASCSNSTQIPLQGESVSLP